MENEIKLIRALKSRDGEEMHKEPGVIYPEPRRQMKGTARMITYMQSSTAEEGPISSRSVMRGKNKWERGDNATGLI